MITIEETTMTAPAPARRSDPIAALQAALIPGYGLGQAPVRLAVVGNRTGPDGDRWECEVGVMDGVDRHRHPADIMRFRARAYANNERFNAALVVPTGIGAELGGHAGDAMPLARLLAASCDTLVTHPNVVNASDLVQLPENCLYVEGSALARLLQGTLALRPVRNNRLLAVIGPHDDELFVNAAVNSVNAARASYGLPEPIIVRLDDGLEMSTDYRPSGRAAGRVSGLEPLFYVLDRNEGRYDAVAITSRIRVPPEYYELYFDPESGMVNPWGGVEAMLTHGITGLYNVPTAHAPMIECRDVINEDPGPVDPRMAAEAVSFTLVQCVLRGLQRSPALVADPTLLGKGRSGLLEAEDLSCLVIPDGCVGLPTLAALQQGMTVIAVRENRNLMRNDLDRLPWAEGQLIRVENYWEAAGVMTALRGGVDPGAVRRPLMPVRPAGGNV